MVRVKFGFDLKRIFTSVDHININQKLQTPITHYWTAWEMYRLPINLDTKLMMYGIGIQLLES